MASPLSSAQTAHGPRFLTGLPPPEIYRPLPSNRQVIAPFLSPQEGLGRRRDFKVSWRSKKAPKHGGGETLAAIGDQAFLYFQQRHVRPAANETEQIVAMGLYTTGTTISPRRNRRDLALGFEARNPAHGAGDADPKTLGCRVARHAIFDHRPTTRSRRSSESAIPAPLSHGDNLQADQISLPRQDPGRGPRRLLPQRRRRPDRRDRHGGLPRCPRAGEARRHCRRRGAARGRSRDLAQAVASRRRAGKLRSEPRRAPLPRRRSRQPPGRSRPRARMGGTPERARSRQGRAFAPPRGASTGALPG